jgi:hypothetical protein
MKRRLKVIAIISLFCGLAAAGFGAWSYYHARTQAELSRSLEQKSFEFEDQSDTVKGTPEEDRLVKESQKYEQAAGEALDSAKGSRQRAIISGIGSIVLILASIAAMMSHLRSREVDLQ